MTHTSWGVSNFLEVLGVNGFVIDLTKLDQAHGLINLYSA